MRRVAFALLVALAAAGCADVAADEDLDAEAAGGEDTSAESALTDRHAVGSLAAASGETRAVASHVAAALGPALESGDRVVVLRTLTYDGVASYVVAHAESFRTSVVAKAALDRASSAGSASTAGALPSRLAALRADDATLRSLELPPRTGAAGGQRVAVTIDMCQSSKRWEKDLFDYLVATGDALGAPIPVGIAMTGGWAKAHPTELAQLLDWHSKKKLDIVWINHSFTHPLHCAGSRCAFMTAPDVDMKREVLDNERLLLSQGAVPSALFRFPGLTHDHRRRAELSELSLAALDADAWLAKGEPMHDGAVVLLHGNGNEPEGVRLFMRAVKAPAFASAIADKKSAFISPLFALGPTAAK